MQTKKHKHRDGRNQNISESEYRVIKDLLKVLAEELGWDAYRKKPKSPLVDKRPKIGRIRRTR